MRRISFAILSYVVAFSPFAAAFGQGQAGFPGYSSVANGINLSNLNVHVPIPIIHKKGRGLSVDLDLAYDGTIYSIANGQMSVSPTGGWTIPLSIGGSVTFNSLTCGSDTSASSYSGVTYTDPLGTAHTLAALPLGQILMSTDPNCAPSQASGYTASSQLGGFPDQSGYFITANVSGAVTVQDRSGNTLAFSVMFAAPTITDSNGNQVTQQLSNNDLGYTITDTLNTPALTTAEVLNGLNPASVTYTYLAPNNTTASIIVSYKIYPAIVSGFGCPNIPEVSYVGPQILGQPAPGVALPDNIQFPDGSKYTFAYEPTPTTSPLFIQGAVTGRLASVTLPTQGVISYSYPGPNGGINCADGTTMHLTRTTSDGTWQYDRAFLSSAHRYNTQVTDPSGTITTISFATNGLEFLRVTTSGSTQPELVSTCYNGCPSNFNIPITKISTSVQLDNGKVNQRVQFLDGTTGLTTEIDEYDYGSGAAGPLLRKTLSTYAFLGNHILDRPSAITVCGPTGNDSDCNGTGSKWAQATFKYDETSPSPSSGVAQHISVSGSRGNLTSTHLWLNTNPTHTLDTSTIVFDTGTRQSFTDAGGHQTSYQYGVGSCNGSFPTESVLPNTNSPALAHHQVGFTYDCDTARLASSTNQNGNVTRYSYDSLLRVIEVDTADSGQAIMSYPSATQSVLQQKISESVYTYSTTLLDAYGRTARIAAANGEALGYDVQDFCYDINGRQNFKSYVYQASAASGLPSCPNPSAPGDSYGFDALDRLVSITHSDRTVSATRYTGAAIQTTDEGNGTLGISRILQQDGLGRVTSVCEIYNGANLLGNGGAPAPCNLDISGSGFLTTYTYDLLDNLTNVVQGASSVRQFTFDSISRLISETSPEAGTVTYTYDADSLLLSRTRPAPNQQNLNNLVTTNYQHDALHRLTSRSYVNDPSGTQAAVFNYDEQNPGGFVAANTVGRVSSECTASAPQSCALFSYDPVGRVKNNWQCTPSTCGTSYYPLSYSYDQVGDMTSATNGSGVTINNSYNIASRLTQVGSTLSDANHPDTLLSGVHYSPTAVADVMGNGVAESTTFSARGLLQSYQALVPSGVPASANIQISGNIASTTTGDAVMANSPLTTFKLSDGSAHTVYLDGQEHVIQLSVTSAGVWQSQDLTALTGSPRAASSSQLSSLVNSGGCPHIQYEDASQHIDDLFELNLSGGGCATTWSYNDLTAITGNTLAMAGSPLTSMALTTDGNAHIFYVGTDNHIYRIYWPLSGGVQNQDFTTLANGVVVASGGNLCSLITAHGDPHVFYEDANQHIEDAHRGSGGDYGNEDLIGDFGGTPAIAGTSLSCLGLTTDAINNVFYLGLSQHIYRLYWPTGGGFQIQDFTAFAGGVPAGSGSKISTLVNAADEEHVFYLDTNNHINDVHRGNGGDYGNDDLTGGYGGPAVAAESALSALGPAADGNSHIFYLTATNSHLDRFYWPTAGGFVNQDITVGPTILDAGTVSITVGGFTATTCYGASFNPACTGQPQNTSASAITSALVTVLSSASSPVTATLSGSTGINMAWKQLGPFTIGVLFNTNPDQPDLFTSPSFTSSTANFGGGSSGSTAAYSYSLGTAPDTQITSTNDLVNGNWVFAYDAFNRLSNSNKNNGQQTFSYAYDRYGNRWQQNAPQGGPAPQYVFDNNNHITTAGVTYDALGQASTDGLGNSFIWDAEGRLAQVQQGGTAVASYTYDAQGRRVRGPSGEYLYDLSGHMISQLVNGIWSYGQIYVGGRHLATYSGGTTNFMHSDWLGTKRVMTGANGAVSETCTGFPFGDGLTCSGANADFNDFSDYVHDTETNLEHTHFRKYSSTQGQWLTPDPYLGSGDPADPHSWNRYSYGNPLLGVDQTGLSGGCLFINGINTPLGRHDVLLNSYGFTVIVYPYPNGGKGEGIGEVLYQDWAGPNDNTSITADNGLNLLSNEPAKSWTVFIYSGGAESVYEAVSSGMVNQSALDAISNVVYLSPGQGLFSSLFGMNLPGSLKFHGTGAADFATTLATRFKAGGHGIGVPCSHGNLSCYLNAIQKIAPQAFSNCHGLGPVEPTIPENFGDILDPLMIDIEPLWAIAPIPVVEIDTSCPTCTVTTESVTIIWPAGMQMAGVNYWPDWLILVP